MAYGDFDLRKAVTDFGLTTDYTVDLFRGVAPVAPSQGLKDWLDEFAPVALGLGSERGRAEAIIFPVLAEAKRRAARPATIASGITFDVDRARSLTGVCDYLISRSPDRFFLRAPVFAAVEAKKEDIPGGVGQCVAELVAVRLFNDREGQPLPAVFGCVTSGNLWYFCKLQDQTVYLDVREYYLSDLPQILGILVAIING